MRVADLGACLLGLFVSAEAFGLELRFGESFLEQGDYLLQPGVQLGLETESKQSFRFDFTGRKFGGFTEATGIFSWHRPYDILPWPAFYVNYGFSLMDEYTAYNSPHGKDEAVHSWNFGVNAGIGWKVYEGDHWNARLEWDSHIFAAGLAFFYLTTARKSVFTAAVGYEI